MTDLSLRDQSARRLIHQAFVGPSLGVCGDFLGGGTVELAALSGLDLAERIGREPPRPLLRERPAPADLHRQEQPA